jgi:hypothetical protein
MALVGSGQISLQDIGYEWQGINLYSSGGLPFFDVRDASHGTAEVYNLGSFYRKSAADGQYTWAPNSYTRVFGRAGFYTSRGNPRASNYGSIPASGAISFSNFYGSQIGE